MKRDSSDASRKKMVGELLKTADRLLKSGEYDKALSEVEKSLELEPGNFYAQAYKERIITLREKHGDAGPGPASTPRDPAPVDPAIPAAEIIRDGADEPAPEPDTEVSDLREQIAREMATQESEAERQAREIARQALEQEIHQGAAAGKLAAAEREATAAATEEGRARARSEAINRAVEAVDRLLSTGDIEGAFTELAGLTIIDPENGQLGELRRRVDAATEKSIGETAGEPEKVSRETICAMFGNILKAAWREGTPGADQVRTVDAARTRLEITPSEEKTLMTKVQREVITEAMREAYRDGDPDPETKSFLDSLTTQLSEAARAGS